MDTQDSPHTSAPDQRERAQEARLNPNDPAKEAATSPQYGDFGKPTEPALTIDKPEGRSGPNDSPDEFSESSDEAKTEARPDKLEEQPGHIMQNQDPQGVAKAQASSADTDELRAAWLKDDPRYAGGGSHNTWTGADPNQANRNIATANKTADNKA